MSHQPVSQAFVEHDGFQYASRDDDILVRLRYGRRVLILRRLLAQRCFATAICAAALLLKLLVPAGYMVASDHGRVTITLCSGIASRPMTIDIPGLQGDTPGHSEKGQGKAEMPCAFSGLSALSLGTIDPILIVALLAFIMAVGLAPAVLPALWRRTYLRPPLRGPPATL
ncbi:MAG: hypothetical protein JWL66_2829 [Sphingomonadales bacterium]|jgi:hypothetical protein|nr:hypothetical protein [Sphingomonadales bacterium]